MFGKIIDYIKTGFDSYAAGTACWALFSIIAGIGGITLGVSNPLYYVAVGFTGGGGTICCVISCLRKYQQDIEKNIDRQELKQEILKEVKETLEKELGKEITIYATNDPIASPPKETCLDSVKNLVTSCCSFFYPDKTPGNEKKLEKQPLIAKNRVTYNQKN